MAPDEQHLLPDVAHIVHYGQAAQYFILTANGQREDVHGHVSQLDERTLFMVLRDRLCDLRRTCAERFGEFRSYCNCEALPVVNDDAQQVFPVSKSLHEPLQFVVRSLAGGWVRACVP